MGEWIHARVSEWPWNVWEAWVSEWVSEMSKWTLGSSSGSSTSVKCGSVWRAVKLVFNLAAAAGCIWQHRGSHYLLTPPLRSLSCGHTAASGVPWPHHSQCTWDFPPESERQNCERQTGHGVGTEKTVKQQRERERKRANLLITVWTKNEGLLTCSVMFQWRIVNTSRDRTAQRTRWHFNSSWETATETNYDLSAAKVWQAADWPCTFNVFWLWNGVYRVTIAAMEHSQV